MANKDQRKPKQGFGVQDPAQPTTDLERQSHIADSVGKGEQLGKVTAVFCGVRSSETTSSPVPLASGAHCLLHQTQSCGKTSVLRFGHYCLMSGPVPRYVVMNQVFCYNVAPLLRVLQTCLGLPL